MRFLRQFLGLFPTKLPKGLEEFEVFAKDIFDLYDIPDFPSYRQAIATMVMHMPPTTHRKSKHHFMRAIRKAQANQVCYEVIQQIREEEKKQQQAVTLPKESPVDQLQDTTARVVQPAQS